MQNPSLTCPQCQSPIPADAPGGLCPACVLLGVAGPTNPSQASAASAPTIEEIAAAFPELEILELIGQGGMGVVFKARQPRLDRLVALKILPPALAAQPGFAERFTREARVLAKLAHPHIVAIYDFGESAGFFYLIMEFVNGVNLRAAMRAGVKPEQALLLVPHICEALQFAHDHGVLHRDIKPENILLDTAGTPKLADFGIAKLAGEESLKTGLTATGAALGTAAYMAPEQVEKPATVDHRADIYSLGVVLYEMLTGELPLGRFGAPSEKSSVSRGVDEVVMRSLEKERERRQQSATAMKTEVEHATAAGSQPHPLPTPAASARELPWSRAAAWGVGLVAASVPIGLLFYFIARQIVSPSFDPQGQLAGPLLGNIIIFGFLPALVGTLLGWKAVSDVRFHRGYLRGGGAAVTAALAVPVMTLLVTLLVYFPVIKEEISPSRTNPWGAIIATLTLLAGVSASVWTVCALWRFVHDGSPGVPVAPRGSAIDASNPRSHRLFWLIVGLIALPVVLIGAGLFVWMSSSSRSGGAYGVGPIELILLVFVLPVGVLAALIFGYRRTRPAAQVATPPATWNPWPKRAFLLILALIVVPALLIVLGLVVPLFAYRSFENPARFREVASLKMADVVTATRAPFLAHLPEGTVEFVAVAPHPSEDKAWWRMDGAAATEGPFRNAGASTFPQVGQRAWEFIIRVRDLPPGSSGPFWQVDDCAGWSGGASPSLTSDPGTPLTGHYLVAATLPRSLGQTNVRAGFASGPWQTLYESNPANSSGTSFSRDGETWDIAAGSAIETKDGDTVVTFSSGRHPAFETRVAALLADGRLVAGSGSTVNDQSEWHFRGTPLATITKLHLQTRPVCWVEFRSVQLAPTSPEK